eukprot:PITA_35070
MNNSLESYLHESSKLDGTNFSNWKFKMQTLLESANVWLIVLGNEQRAGNATQEQDWDKRETKAKVILKMSVKDNIIPHIRDCKSAADIWNTIKGLYETQNSNRVLALKGKLFALKMGENESVGGFMARVKDLKDQLGAIGEKVSDSDLVTLTLNRMTDEYQTFISALSAREKAPLFDELTTILLQEEERRQNLKTQGNDLALMAKRRQHRGKQRQYQQQQQQPQQQQKGANSFQGKSSRGMTNTYVKRCFYCGKAGHQIRECYKKQVDERRSKQKKHQGCFAEEDEDHNYDLRLFTVDCALSASRGDDDNTWYVDSGASSHMTGIKKNLISISMITDQDMQVQFFKNGCVIQDSKLETVATGVRVGNLYRLDARSIPQQAMVAATSTAENLWHQRFGHINLQDLILLKNKGMVDGLPTLHNIKLECDGCALGNMHRDEFPVHVNRKQRDILELVHTDICGPMQTRSLGVMIENQTAKKIKILCSDQGGEYRLNEFMNFCKQHGIIQQFTVPHTPQQNGVAERKNRTLVECARSMLQGKGISNGLWVEAINTDVYLKNRSPTKCLGFKTLFEALFGLKPAVDHLRIFGSKAFAHVPKPDRKKLDPKALKCIFVGYGTEYKAYKLYNPVTHKVFASRDVIFHEQTKDGKKDSDDESHIPFFIELNNEDEEEQVQEQEQKQGEVAADGIISDDTGLDSTETERVEVSSLPRRSGRKTRLPAKLRDYALMSKILNIVEPLNYEEASRSDEWRVAMHEEMESIYRNHTWDLVELPEGKTPIGCKWLYKPKINADGIVEKFKARLVAKGYSQQEGIDFDDTFAPVAKLNTIRMLICLATKHKWKLHQLDVKSAFLNGELKEEIYLVQPHGFVKKGQKHLVCKLHKAFYGLKQAPRSWYDKIDSFFVQHSFHKSLNDPNLYTKINKQRQIILISLYVDYMIITGNA